jgi:hypothetical protein
MIALATALAVAAMSALAANAQEDDAIDNPDCLAAITDAKTYREAAFAKKIVDDQLLKELSDPTSFMNKRYSVRLSFDLKHSPAAAANYVVQSLNKLGIQAQFESFVPRAGSPQPRLNVIAKIDKPILRNQIPSIAHLVEVRSANYSPVATVTPVFAVVKAELKSKLLALRGTSESTTILQRFFLNLFNKKPGAEKMHQAVRAIYELKGWPNPNLGDPSLMIDLWADLLFHAAPRLTILMADTLNISEPSTQDELAAHILDELFRGPDPSDPSRDGFDDRLDTMAGKLIELEWKAFAVQEDGMDGIELTDEVRKPLVALNIKRILLGARRGLQ